MYEFIVGRSQSMVPDLVMELLVLRPLQSQSKRDSNLLLNIVGSLCTNILLKKYNCLFFH